jgi:ATP-dependent DNA helicase RecQ
VAAPREPTDQTAFFQAAALPAGIVEALHLSDIDHRILRAAAQWRLDYPLPLDLGVDRAVRPILAVVEGILTRGTTPFCSPALEAALGGGLSVHDVADIEAAVRRLALWPTARFEPRRFDSQEEGLLAKQLSELLAGHALPWTIVPQVALSSLSLTADPNAAERGDFLLVHPEQAAILVEVDGVQHAAHRSRDTARDRALAAAGVETVRIPASQVRRGSGPELDALSTLVMSGAVELPSESRVARMLRWAKWLHQVQIALLVALKSRWLDPRRPWTIGVVLPTPLMTDAERATELVELAVAEFRELAVRVARLHGQDLAGSTQVVICEPHGSVDDLDLLVGPADGRADDIQLAARVPRFLVSDASFPGEIHAPVTATEPSYPRAPTREDAAWFLRYVFRKQDFWEGQWETIHRSLRGQDSVVLLPTGAGKSIAFQLAALLLPGRCVVVAPIVSLIEDQIDNLARYGIDRVVGITSELGQEEREQAVGALASGHYLFCYVAPERFQTVRFREALRALTTNTPVSMVAIDEAHCVSEWGHDFRTAYLNLGPTAREYCTSAEVTPPLVALTGTASKIVLRDVQRELGIVDFEAVITPTSFDRPELRYAVLKAPSREKLQRVHGFLNRLPTEFGVDRGRFFAPGGEHSYAGLVFCPHVNGSYGVVDVARTLRTALQVKTAIYSGEPPRRFDDAHWRAEKRQATHDFKRNKTSLLVCTKAFGMGIDKPNIRYTVHIGLPPSIESFYQEAGRAGRDRKSAVCAIVLSNDDPVRSQWLLAPGTPLAEVARVIDQTVWEDADDVTRALFFHVRAFRGESAEIDDIEAMLEALGDVTVRRQRTVSWRVWKTADQPASQDARVRAEKALHRLVILGVVQDYTLDYAAHEFVVRIAGASQEEIATALGRYAGAYQRRLGEELEAEILSLRKPDHRRFILEAAERLIAFVYQHVELARRRALAEMLQAASSAQTGEDLRRRIVDYLQQTEWDQRLEPVRSSTEGGMDALSAVLDDVAAPTDALLLRAAAGRQLSSYPDVPGLLVLRATAEMLSADADTQSAQDDVRAAVGYAIGKYRLSTRVLAQGLAHAIASASAKDGAAEVLLLAILGAEGTDRALIRALLPLLPARQGPIAAQWLLAQLAIHVDTLLT